MIYLDYQATTPVAPEVAAAMRPWAEDHFANPHAPSRAGREAAAAIEVARKRVLDLLLPSSESMQPVSAEGLEARTAAMLLQTQEEFGLSAPADLAAGQLFFTSGATEAANWAIKGTWSRRAPDRHNVVTVATEHACVLDSIGSLQQEGAEVRILRVGSDGLLSFADLEQAIDLKTALVAVMAINNEIGVRQQISRVGNLARKRGAAMFCDAVQSFGREGVAVGSCDLVAISAHKIHGPKGIGALWVRKGYEPEPLLHGGGQEGGYRSGTLSPALCVGFGEAAHVAKVRSSRDFAHLQRLWVAARSTLKGPMWTLNGSRVQRYRGNLNIRCKGLDGARLISDLRDIAFSVGSACANGSGRPSHVLRALGLSDREARSSIRLGFGRYTTEEELVDACRRIDAAARAQLDLAA